MNDRVENKSKLLVSLLTIYFAATPLDYVLPHIGDATVLLVLGLLISALAIFLALGHNRAMLDGGQTCVFLLALLMAVSNIWATDTSASFSYTLSFVATSAMFFLLFFFKFTKQEIEQLETASILGGVLFIVYVFTQVDMASVMSGYRLNLQSVGNENYFSDPNGLAARLIMPFVFTVKRIFENKNKRLKLLYIALMGLMVYIIFLTGSRAALLSVVLVAVIVVASFGVRRLGMMVAFGVVALAVILLVPGLLPEHIINRLFKVDTYQEMLNNEGDRIHIWKNILFGVFPKSPLVGHGAGNAQVALAEFYGSYKSAHNSWLTMLADLGVLGFVLWMSFVFGKLKQAFTIRKKSIYALAVLVGVLFMASTLDATKEKYLWNGFLYAHMMATMYCPEEKK